MLTINRVTSIVGQVYLSGLRAEWCPAMEHVHLTNAECDIDQQGITLGPAAFAEHQADYDAAIKCGASLVLALHYAVRGFA